MLLFASKLFPLRVVPILDVIVGRVFLDSYVCVKIIPFWLHPCNFQVKKYLIPVAEIDVFPKTKSETPLVSYLP